MRRREFIALAVFLAGLGAAVALPFSPGPAGAQTKTHRIGFLGNSPHNAALWQAFLDGLREHGWENGRNVVVESRWAEGRPERYAELASELVSLNMDVIVASTPPAVRAAQQATRSVPIIMTAVGDPVTMGFVASLSNPRGNVTGVASTAGAGFLSKLLELTKEALVSASRVGILFNEGNPLNYATASAPEIRAAAQALNLELVWLPVRNADDFEPALLAARRGSVDAIVGIGDPLLFLERNRIHDLAEKARLPTVWPTREYLSGRGLLSHGPSLHGLMRHAASFVDKMLRGANPATTPVEQPTRYEFILNLKTAKALGITLPPLLLARADEVIE